MTKKERAEMEAAIERAELLAALRWTSPVARDVIPPEAFGEYNEGWDYTVHSRTVWLGWSSFDTHGKGSAPTGQESRSFAHKVGF